jgi:hypothetical protein
MPKVIVLVVVALAFFTVGSGFLRGLFAKPGPPPQRVVIVSPVGPGLWQRLAGGIVAAVLIAFPAGLLLRATAGTSGDYVVPNYFQQASTPSSTPTAHPATTAPKPTAATKH